MTQGDDFDRITFDTKIMGGQACIRGMRMPVATVVKLVASGMSHDEILHEYPYLQEEDIRQALNYVARLAEDRLLTLRRTP